jgi:hypothetical protein
VTSLADVIIWLSIAYALLGVFARHLHFREVPGQ